MPINDREVYLHFHGHADDPPEVSALAYAGFAKSKYDWVEHFEARERRAPTAEEMDHWIADLPMSRLEDLRQDAIDFFDLAARAYMEADLMQAAEAAKDQVILKEIVNIGLRIHHMTSFWRNPAPNTAVGVFASLIFSMLIMMAAAIYTRDPSPFALFRSVQTGYAIAPTVQPQSHQ